ncbi:hypothetical protein DL766_008616 [Monosporascus sp. MC13-8B]|uniref:SNF2 N-terminal domain-containing protein n=1 Tax=Monosporascus cannonballus TaxID=155416 RepID=A0ABY0H0H7_9PEZI|nr:hypothetical protein DL762_008418 [Monosporascus cannonballus]RYO82083.1 hypothetical protein DL763_008354 [Monosporascus cannonballus]RYP18683.1 hypothetical protein DL766_008616 [Monosporascus sp. MC13-8B]
MPTEKRLRVFSQPKEVAKTASMLPKLITDGAAARLVHLENAIAKHYAGATPATERRAAFAAVLKGCLAFCGRTQSFLKRVLKRTLKFTRAAPSSWRRPLAVDDEDGASPTATPQIVNGDVGEELYEYAQFEMRLSKFEVKFERVMLDEAHHVRDIKGHCL